MQPFSQENLMYPVNGTKEIKDGKMIELDAYNGKVYILE